MGSYFEKIKNKILKINLSRFLKLKIGQLEEQKLIKYVLKILLITLIFSLLLPLISEIIDSVINEEKEKINLQMFYYTPGIFVNILPVILVTKKNLLVRDSPKKAIMLIFYYIVFLPIFEHGIKNIAKVPENLFVLKIITIINIGFLIMCHYVLFKYSFTDILTKKRKILVKDIFITFSIYLTIALSFGYMYSMIGILSKTPALLGIDYSNSGLVYYFKNIYFSFMTLTTVGYGDIVPNIVLTELIVIIEVILGIALLNFTLGITLGSGILNFNSETEEEKKKKL